MTTGKVPTSTWQEIKAKKFSPEQLRQLDDGVEQELLEMDLRALREAAGLTQEELAQRVAVTQSQLSKLERREDFRLSTLRRYVAALGGQLEIIAVVDGKRIHLSQGA
jgi:DNA-binding transcriptional regulator YiaG